MYARERINVIPHGARQQRLLNVIIPTAVMLVATTLTPTTASAIGRWRRGTPRTQQPDLVVERVWTDPGSPVSGQPVQILSRIRNRGSLATSPGSRIRVGYAFNGRLATWGEISGPLAAGASVEVPHTGPGVRAGAAGSRIITAIVDVAGLIKESNERNNQRSVTVAITGTGSSPAPAPAPAPPAPPPAARVDAAAVVRHSLPDRMVAGTTTTVEVEVRNTGTTVWGNRRFRLGSVNDGAGDAARLMAAQDHNRVYMPSGARVGPGQTHTFRFVLRAPAQPATFQPAWQMVHEGVRWFGAQANATVAVEAAPAVPRRTGRVRLDRNSLVDDGGRFNALGTTLMWAAWAYKFDRPKLEAALDLLSRNGFHYIRALGVVGDPNGPDYWDGREILWQWPDYNDIIAGVTDLAYDRYGLRVQWTLIGDGQVSVPRRSDRYGLADRFLAMSRGREHKIILIETANEFWQNGFDGNSGVRELRELTRYINQRTDILVAASAPASADEAEAREIYEGGIADVATIHFDRQNNLADGPWRPVRQPWHHAYWSDVPVGSNNEPIGPGASVATENSPVRLVAAAIATYVSNIPMYVFHTGAGVRGDQDLASMPGVTSFVHLSRLIPGGLASWQRQNHHWQGSPFRVYAEDRDGNLVEDRMWPDLHRARSGAVRAFSGIRGNEFFTFPMGIRQRVVMEARRDCEFDVIDPMSGNTVDHKVVSAGQRFELSGGEIFILRGRFR